MRKMGEGYEHIIYHAHYSNRDNQKYIKSFFYDFPGDTVDKNRLPMQGTQVWYLAQEDPTGPRAIEPVCTAMEASAPAACAPQYEKPLQWAVCALLWYPHSFLCWLWKWRMGSQAKYSLF